MSSEIQEEETSVAVWVSHVALTPQEEAAVLRAYKLMMGECETWTHRRVSRACAETVVEQLTSAGVEARIIDDEEPSSYRFS